MENVKEQKSDNQELSLCLFVFVFVSISDFYRSRSLPCLVLFTCLLMAAFKILKLNFAQDFEVGKWSKSFVEASL